MAGLKYSDISIPFARHIFQKGFHIYRVLFHEKIPMLWDESRQIDQTGAKYENNKQYDSRELVMGNIRISNYFKKMQEKDEEYKKACRICLKEGRKVPELPVNAGEYVLYEMWQKSIKEDTRRLELDRCLTPDTAKEFISAMRTAGINNFVFTAKRGAVMNNIMVFLNEGCRMEGNTTLIKHGRKKTKSVDGLFFVVKCREYIKIRVTNKSEEDKNGNIIYTVAAGEGQDALCVRVKYSKKDNLMSVVETPPDLTDMELLELMVSKVGNYRVTQEIGAMTASVLEWSMENNRDNL